MGMTATDREQQDRQVCVRGGDTCERLRREAA